MTRRTLAALAVATLTATAATAAAATSAADGGYTLTGAVVSGAGPTQMTGGAFTARAAAGAIGVEQPQGGIYALAGRVVATVPQLRLLLPRAMRQDPLGEDTP